MDTMIFIIVSLIVSFLGGGVVSAGINQWCMWRQDVNKEKMRLIELQLQKLYGPLFWHLSRSEKALELSRKILAAGDVEYSGKDSAEEDIQKTIGVSNEYVSLVKYNNTKALEILNENYVFIDPDDIDVFNLFYEHYIRLITEFNEQGSKVPLKIYKRMGDISFLRNEYIGRLKEKYLSKRKKWSGGR